MKVKIEQNVEQNSRYNSSRFLSYHKVFNQWVILKFFKKCCDCFPTWRFFPLENVFSFYTFKISRISIIKKCIITDQADDTIMQMFCALHYTLVNVKL